MGPRDCNRFAGKETVLPVQWYPTRVIAVDADSFLVGNRIFDVTQSIAGSYRQLGCCRIEETPSKSAGPDCTRKRECSPF